MRLIAWNCNRAYGKKAEQILKFNPDIAVVPECEKIGEDNPKRVWFGDNINLRNGIGIFSYSNYNLKLLSIYNQKFKYVIPIKVTDKTSFNLLAVWTKNDDNVNRAYIGQLWSAINYYNDILAELTIIIGDFNWDKKIDDKYKLPIGIIKVSNFLKEINIESAYHKHFNQKFGQETKPAEFHTKNFNKTYHVDYCFASQDFLNKLRNVEVGEFKDWIKYSDHMPIIVDFEDKT